MFRYNYVARLTIRIDLNFLTVSAKPVSNEEKVLLNAVSRNFLACFVVAAHFPCQGRSMDDFLAGSGHS